MDLGFDLEGTVAIVTGAGGQIGQVIVDAFLSAGCFVGALDIDESKFGKNRDRLFWVAADTTSYDSMALAWAKVGERYGSSPTVCVCAAALDLSFVKHHDSIVNMPTEQFRKTLDVNVTGTFIASKLWLSNLLQSPAKPTTNGSHAALVQAEESTDDTPSEQQIPLRYDPKNLSLIIIGSEAGVLGVPGNPDYAASKSAIQYGLTLSLAPDAARIHPRARVNAVCPGAVDTVRFRQECVEDERGLMRWTESEATVASRKSVQIHNIARICLVLASERWSASTTGQSLNIDCGKSGRLFWDKEGNATW